MNMLACKSSLAFTNHLELDVINQVKYCTIVFCDVRHFTYVISMNNAKQRVFMHKERRCDC